MLGKVAGRIHGKIADGKIMAGKIVDGKIHGKVVVGRTHGKVVGGKIRAGSQRATMNTMFTPSMSTNHQQSQLFTQNPFT